MTESSGFRRAFAVIAAFSLFVAFLPSVSLSAVGEKSVRAIVPADTAPKIGDPVSLAAIEELHIRRVLAASASLQEAADVLGFDQATLWRRRKAYGI